MRRCGTARKSASGSARTAPGATAGDTVTTSARSGDQLATALRVRLAAGHNDTCGALLSSGDGVYACTCGHLALAAALEGEP